MEKFHKIIYILFLIESLLLTIGISLGKISYGENAATPIMQLKISALLIIITLFRLFSGSLKKRAMH